MLLKYTREFSFNDVIFYFIYTLYFIYTFRYVVIIQERYKAASNPLASLRLDLALLFDFLDKHGINTLVEPGFISETY